MASSTWLTETEQQAWRCLLALHRQVFEALDRQLQSDSGMPHTYYMILVTLSEAPRRIMRMSDLATATGTSPSRISHAAARLEHNGWVRRRPCSTDGRGTVAELTDAGFAALATAAPGHVAAVRRQLFDRLSPEQVDQLTKICGSVLNAEPPEPTEPVAQGG